MKTFLIVLTITLVVVPTVTVGTTAMAQTVNTYVVPYG